MNYWHAVGLFVRLLHKVNPTHWPDLNLNEAENLGTIAVLGRGPSASAFTKSDRKYDAVIAANFLESDFVFPGMAEKISETGYLIYLGNRAEDHVPVSVLRDLPLATVAWTGLHRSFGSQRKRISGRLSGLGKKVQSLPLDFTPALFEKTSNAGLIAVALAAMRAKEVDIFGLDFYETGYLSTSEAESWGREDLAGMVPYGESLVERFEGLVRHFPEVKFHLFTQSVKVLAITSRNLSKTAS